MPTPPPIDEADETADVDRATGERLTQALVSDPAQAAVVGEAKPPTVVSEDHALDAVARRSPSADELQRMSLGVSGTTGALPGQPVASARRKPSGESSVPVQIAEALLAGGMSVGDAAALTPPPLVQQRPNSIADRGALPRKDSAAATTGAGAVVAAPVNAVVAPNPAAAESREAAEARVLAKLFGDGASVARFEQTEFDSLDSRYATQSFIHYAADGSVAINQHLLDALVLADKNAPTTAPALFDEIRNAQRGASAPTPRLDSLIRYQVYATGHHIMTDDEREWSVKLAQGLQDKYPGDLAGVPLSEIALEVSKHSMCKTKYSEPSFALMRSDTPQFVKDRFRFVPIEESFHIREGRYPDKEGVANVRHEVMYDCTAMSEAEAVDQARRKFEQQGQFFTDAEWTAKTGKLNMTPYNPAESKPVMMQVPVMAESLKLNIRGTSYTLGDGAAGAGIAITDEDAGVFSRSLNSQRVIEFGEFDADGNFCVLQLKGAGVPEYGFNGPSDGWTGGEYLDVATETEAAALKDFAKQTSKVAHIAPDCLGQASVADPDHTAIYEGDGTSRVGAVTFRLDRSSGGMRLANVKPPATEDPRAAMMAALRDGADPVKQAVKHVEGKTDATGSKARLAAAMQTVTGGRTYDDAWRKEAGHNIVKSSAVANLLGMKYDDQNCVNLEDVGIAGEFFDTGGINDISEGYKFGDLTINTAVQSLQLTDEEINQLYVDQIGECLRSAAEVAGPEDKACIERFLDAQQMDGDPEQIKRTAERFQVMCGQLGARNDDDTQSVKVAFMKDGLRGFAQSFVSNMQELGHLPEAADAPDHPVERGRASLPHRNPDPASIPPGPDEAVQERVHKERHGEAGVGAADADERKVSAVDDRRASVALSPPSSVGQSESEQAVNDKAEGANQVPRAVARYALNKMVESGEVAVVSDYDQGKDPRLEHLDITNHGWCLGMSAMWLVDGHDDTLMTANTEARVERTRQSIADAEQLLNALADGAGDMSVSERSQAKAEQEREIVRLRKVLQTEEQNRAAQQGSFWDRHQGQDAAGRYRFIMAAQGLRIEAADGKLQTNTQPKTMWNLWRTRRNKLIANLDDRAAFRLNRGGLGALESSPRRTGEDATAAQLAQDICDTPSGGFCRIGQTYVGGGGHAMAARVEKDGAIRFMDPNGGEYKFANSADFKKWFPIFCHSQGYDFASHYVERYQSKSDPITPPPAAAAVANVAAVEAERGKKSKAPASAAVEQGLVGEEQGVVETAIASQEADGQSPLNTMLKNKAALGDATSHENPSDLTRDDMAALINHAHAMWQGNGAPAQSGELSVKKIVPMANLENMIIRDKRDNLPGWAGFKKKPGMGGFVAAPAATDGLTASQIISQLGLDYNWKQDGDTVYAYLKDDGQGGLKPLDVVFAFESTLDADAEAQTDGRSGVTWDKKLRMPLDPKFRLELERLMAEEPDSPLGKKAAELHSHSFDNAVERSSQDAADDLDKDIAALEKRIAAVSSDNKLARNELQTQLEQKEAEKKARLWVRTEELARRIAQAEQDGDAATADALQKEKARVENAKAKGDAPYLGGGISANAKEHDKHFSQHDQGAAQHPETIAAKAAYEKARDAFEQEQAAQEDARRAAEKAPRGTVATTYNPMRMAGLEQAYQDAKSEYESKRFKRDAGTSKAFNQEMHSQEGFVGKETKITARGPNGEHADIATVDANGHIIGRPPMADADFMKKHPWLSKADGFTEFRQAYVDQSPSPQGQLRRRKTSVPKSDVSTNITHLGFAKSRALNKRKAGKGKRSRRRT